MKLKSLIYSVVFFLFLGCTPKVDNTKNGEEPFGETPVSLDENHEFSAEYFNGDDYIIYENLGQPLPPKFYKKYKFEVSINEIKLSIGNYKETLHTDKKPLDKSSLEQIISKIKLTNLVPCDKKESKGCTGGHSENLNYKIANVHFSGNAYTCGQVQYGNICGAPKELSTLLKSLFPDFKDRLKG